MKGLLDLERQGYGFRVAKLCFKAHWVLNRVTGNKIVRIVRSR